MEKRTILAFALSFLVLILWSFLFNPSKDQVSKKGETPETVAPKTVSQSPETASPPHAAISKAPEKTKFKLAPETDEKEVVVDTPLYRAVLTNAGPTIKSFKLKEYRESVEPDSPLIDLIDLQQEKADFLIISFDGASASQPEKTIYQVEHQKIRLESDSSPKNLVFHSSTSGGISISQTYRFYPVEFQLLRLTAFIRINTGSISISM
jgi:YidC/Oxa1 family membrane protein insertase